jgi:glucose/arabinose dehydrogenase
MKHPAPLFRPCRLGLLAVALVSSLQSQALVRTPATSLQFPAAAPATTYATTPAFAGLSFTQPVALVSAPGDTRRLFVVEKPGRIWLIPDVTAAAPTRSLFLDLTSRVSVSTNPNDERGLLALAFHPEYASNRQFFVWYTTTATTGAGSGLHNRLSRFRASATDANAADLGSEEPLLTQRDEANNHNGGELLFGPDGYLYLSLGDEGGANDQYQNAFVIDRDFFAGILRLDVDRRPGSLAPNAHPAVHAGAYAVPADNPFVGASSFNGQPVSPAAVRTELWATGLRNPWRMAFDSATGQLWCADVGQGAREEINVIARGGNYGWPFREGTLSGPRTTPPAGASFIAPVWEYGRSEGFSVTGGLLYRGPKYAALQGRYLFADFGSGRVWALQPDGANPVEAARVQLLTTDAGISSFGLDPATGDILLADLLDGSIKRLVASTSSGGPPFPSTLSATGAFADTATLTPAAGLVAYEPNVSFWSDHAHKRRWFALPDPTSRFGLERDGPWSLPAGAVWVKHFDLELTRGNPATSRRIETRVLVKTSEGVYGLSYRWNDAQTDATLVPDEGADQTFTITENGASRSQTWRFPSRAECLTCHTAVGGHALSFNTRQLNRGDFLPQLIAAGYVQTSPGFVANSAPALARADDPNASLEHRARSYLDANCSQCHQPGGAALGSWDARVATPLALANLLDGTLVDHGGNATNRVIVPGDPTRSHVLTRMAIRGPGQMPPLASNERDLAGETLLRQWIAALADTPAPPNGPSTSRIVNLAARAEITSGTQLIAGFVIAGPTPKRVLIRGVGPTLNSAFGVSRALVDPSLTILGPDTTTRIAASNDNWQAADAAAFSAAGAFPLAAASRDAAVITQLAPGSYTAQLAGTGDGVALVELYDLEPSSESRLVNLAVRAFVGTGDNILIPGIAVGPGSNKTLLIRAVGPGLAPFGVSNPLASPILTLLSGSQAIATNTRWATAGNAGDISAAANRVGAFALADGDSALLRSLPPGSYTLQVSGANNATGTALIEVYDVP